MASTTTSQARDMFAARLGIASPEGHSVLYNHPTQSSTAIDGWKSALFGLPFLAAGLGIAFATVHGPADNRHAPVWVIWIIAGMFGLAGAFLTAHGLRGVVDDSLYKRRAAERPGEPWLYDYRWRAVGCTFSAFDDMLKRLLAALLWNAFLVPFGWVGFTVRGAWPFLAATIIFGLLGLIFWGRWLTMLMDLLRYGNSFLRYESFPFSLGGKLSCQLRAPRHVADIEELTLTLRCVQEKYVETRDSQNRRTTQVVCYELYSDTTTYERDRLAAVSDAGIPIEFRIPADQPSTTLASHPPTYWEIEAKGKASGVDYQALFLVPVYKS